MVQLEKVFGITQNVDSYSYVDRGGLDVRFRRALVAHRHVAVHGGSKQGKTWLRSKGIDDKKAIIIQCVPTSSPEKLFEQALGKIGVKATLGMTENYELEGSLEGSLSGEAGVSFLAKAKARIMARFNYGQSKAVESQVIGRNSADLNWVCSALSRSRKVLIFEDFHYLSEDSQKTLAFIFKAMGEYGVFVVVVGVWAKDHLLTYYNGDLDGRVEDIHLTWDDSELKKVLEQGSKALNVKFHSTLADSLVKEASGSVGLLQRLAERLCSIEGIYETCSGSQGGRTIELGDSYAGALKDVADQMEGRFQTFGDNFVKGMRRMPKGLEVYKHLLAAATEATDEELINGYDSADLLKKIKLRKGGSGISSSSLTQALDRIDKLQEKIEVNPPVFTYVKSNRKLFLADRSFLFYRRNSKPDWLWMNESENISNDLAGSNPLELEN